MKNISFINNNVRTIRTLGIVEPYGPLYFDTDSAYKVLMGRFYIALSMDVTNKIL